MTNDLQQAAEERRRKARRNARIDTAAKVGLYAAAAVAVLAIVAALYALAGLIFSALVWNIGVVGLVSAAGGSVSKIGFWTGVGAVFLISVIRQLLFGSVRVSKDA